MDAGFIPEGRKLDAMNEGQLWMRRCYLCVGVNSVMICDGEGLDTSFLREFNQLSGAKGAIGCSGMAMIINKHKNTAKRTIGYE